MSDIYKESFKNFDSKPAVGHWVRWTNKKENWTGGGYITKVNKKNVVVAIKWNDRKTKDFTVPKSEITVNWCDQQ